MNHLTIGQLAEQGGVNLETIRYYERRGILPHSPRPSSGSRAFSDEVVRRVRFIMGAQAIGCSLSEIKTLLSRRSARTCPRASRKCNERIVAPFL